MDENQKKHSTRWNYYIDRNFQNRFMLRFSLVILLVSLITLSALWLLRENAYELLPGKSGILVSMDTENVFHCTLPDGSVYDMAVPRSPYNAFQLYWKPIVFVSAVNLLIIIIFALFFSHSMAGPIHRIQNSVRDLIDGKEPRPIRIRKGDQFQELADLLNELIEKRVK